MKSLRIVLVAVLMALPWAARATELKLWHAYRAEEKAAIEKVVAEYNASRAAQGIKVTTLAIPYDAMADKISAAVPLGKGPDVFIYAQDRLGGWIEAGNTVDPIDFYLDKATRESFLPTTFQAMTYRKQVFGLPLNFKVITMIYNKKLVPKPPRTSKELVALAKKLTKKKAGRFGLAYSYADFYYHAALMNAFGGRVFDPGPTPVLNIPENIKALELLMRWFDKDGFLPAEPSTALITSLFNEGKAAIVFSGPWFLGEIAKEVNYGLAMLPTIDEAGGAPMRPWMTVEGVYMTHVSGDTPEAQEKKDAAFDFIKYLTSLPAAKIMAVEGRQCPALKAAYEDPKIGADPILKAFRDQVEVAIPMPNLPEMTMTWSPVTTAMNGIVKKATTPQAAMDVAQEAVLKDVAGLRNKKP